MDNQSPSKQLSPRQRSKLPAHPHLLTSQIHLSPQTLDQQIPLLISQYLHSHEHHHIASIFDSEVLGINQDEERKLEYEEVERCITDGDFSSLENLLLLLLKGQRQKAFIYLCYRQQFLEHIENREYQKGFNLLQKRLKPLEHYQPVPYDFYNLCYLTSAGTVHDAPGLKDWGGTEVGREGLRRAWRELMSGGGGIGEEKPFVEKGRLETLMLQAAAWQVGNAKRRGAEPWSVTSLLKDYAVRSVPNNLRKVVEGHRANVKCVDFIGDDGAIAVSGSSDGTLRIFSTETGETFRVLSGHTSRVWSCSTSNSAQHIASASGDRTVRVWSTGDGLCRSGMNGDGGDVYAVKWRPGHNSQIATASYDKILRLWDVERGSQVRTFSGHDQSTLCVAFDPTGKVLASGAKDKQMRLWDAIGGVCVQTLTASLGEVTSVEFDSTGRYLLAGCKDNSNRLWDLRMQRNIYRYTGHQNTSKNLIRCTFGGADSELVIGGSEDGMVYIWEREAPEINTNNPPQATTTQSNGDSSENSALITPRLTSPPTFAPSSILNLSVPAETRASPAYYPPRAVVGIAKPQVGSLTTNVRPIKALGGHGEGAVFDVKWGGEGLLVSAGEDGKVGVWDTQEEEAE